MAPNNGKRLFYGYVIVIAVFIVLSVIWGTVYSFGVFFKPVLNEFGWLRASTSGAFSLCIVLNGLVGIFSGRLTDKFGPRAVMSVCGLFIGAGYLFMSRINAIWQLYLFYGVFIGIGISCGYAPSVSTVARWFVKRRGLMIGLAVAGIGFGTVIVPPIANWLISSYGWRTCYLIIGMASLVLILTFAQLLKKDPSQMHLEPYGKQENGSYAMPDDSVSFERAIHSAKFWILSMMLLCFGFILGIVMVHIVAHATDLGISTAQAASILSVIGGVSIIGRIAIGSASEKLGNRQSALLCFSLIVFSVLLLLIARQLWLFYIFSVVLGFAYGGLATLSPLLEAEFFGLTALGAIAGAVNFSATIGESLGPLVAGNIFDTWGSYLPAFFLCLFLGIVSTFLALWMKRAR